MTADEQAALAQMMMGVRTQIVGLLQQMDGLLRLLTKDTVPAPPERRMHYLGEDDA